MPQQPLVLINAVGLTSEAARACAATDRPRRRGVVADARRGCAGRDLHRAGEPADRTHPAGPRDRRQWLAVPRDGRGPVLAAVERAPPGRADLRHRPAAAPSARPDVPRRQALLVVQPGCGRCDQRDAEAALRCRRQQGLRHHRHARRPVRAARGAAGTLPVPHLLGAGRGAALHRLDRPSVGRGAGRRAARSDARLPAASRLRPPALRSVGLRHAPAGPRAGRRLRPAARRRPLREVPASGSSASTGTSTSAGPST